MKKCLRALSCGKRKKRGEHGDSPAESSAPRMGSPVRAHEVHAAATPVHSTALPRSPRFRYTPHAEEQRHLLGSAARPSSAAGHKSSMGPSPRPVTVSLQSEPRLSRRHPSPAVRRGSLVSAPASFPSSHRPDAADPLPSSRHSGAIRTPQLGCAYTPLPAVSTPSTATPTPGPTPPPTGPASAAPRSASVPHSATLPQPTLPSPALPEPAAPQRGAAPPAEGSGFLDVLDELQKRRAAEPHRFVDTDANAIVTVGCKGMREASARGAAAAAAAARRAPSAAAPPPPPPVPVPGVPAGQPPPVAQMADILQHIRDHGATQLQPVTSRGDPVQKAPVPAMPDCGSVPRRGESPLPLAGSATARPRSGRSGSGASSAWEGTHGIHLSLTASASPHGCPSTSLPRTSRAAAFGGGDQLHLMMPPEGAQQQHLHQQQLMQQQQDVVVEVEASEALARASASRSPREAGRVGGGGVAAGGRPALGAMDANVLLGSRGRDGSAAGKRGGAPRCTPPPPGVAPPAHGAKEGGRRVVQQEMGGAMHAAPSLLQEAWRRGPANVWRSEPEVDAEVRSRSRCSSACGDVPGSPLALHDGGEEDARSAASSEPFMVSTSVAPMHGGEAHHRRDAAAARRVEYDVLPDPHTSLCARDSIGSAARRQHQPDPRAQQAGLPPAHRQADQPSAEVVVMRLDHGDEYRGTVSDGVPHGKGSLHYTNGNSYEGFLQEGLKWGRGIFRWRNGDCYKGEFVRDVFHGHGTFSFANSTVTYTGAFREGMFIGPMPEATRGNVSDTPMGRPPAQAPSPSVLHPMHRHMGSPSERSITGDRAVVQLDLSAPDAEGLDPYWPSLPWGDKPAPKGSRAIFNTLHAGSEH